MTMSIDELNVTVDQLELMEVMCVPILIHLVKDRLLVDAYCARKRTMLAEIDINSEEGMPQGLIYIFNDKSGGYTRRGLENSLRGDD